VYCPFLCFTSVVNVPSLVIGIGEALGRSPKGRKPTPGPWVVIIILGHIKVKIKKVY
jgi:hypothetical protein